MNRELGFSYSLLNDSYAAGSATLCVGALMFIPVALKFGRRLVCHKSHLSGLRFGLGC